MLPTLLLKFALENKSAAVVRPRPKKLPGTASLTSGGRESLHYTQLGNRTALKREMLATGKRPDGSALKPDVKLDVKPIEAPAKPIKNEGSTSAPEGHVKDSPLAALKRPAALAAGGAAAIGGTAALTAPSASDGDAAAAEIEGESLKNITENNSKAYNDLVETPRVGGDRGTQSNDEAELASIEGMAAPTPGPEAMPPSPPAFKEPSAEENAMMASATTGPEVAPEVAPQVAKAPKGPLGPSGDLKPAPEPVLPAFAGGGKASDLTKAAPDAAVAAGGGASIDALAGGDEVKDTDSGTTTGTTTDTSGKDTAAPPVEPGMAAKVMDWAKENPGYVAGGVGATALLAYMLTRDDDAPAPKRRRRRAAVA